MSRPRQQHGGTMLFHLLRLVAVVLLALLCICRTRVDAAVDSRADRPEWNKGLVTAAAVGSDSAQEVVPVHGRTAAIAMKEVRTVMPEMEIDDYVTGPNDKHKPHP